MGLVVEDQTALDEGLMDIGGNGYVVLGLFQDLWGEELESGLAERFGLTQGDASVTQEIIRVDGVGGEHGYAGVSADVETQPFEAVEAGGAVHQALEDGADVGGLLDTAQEESELVLA